MTNVQSQNTSTNGRWTKEQHEKFLLGLQIYGKNWKKIQTLVGSRNGSQIRSHAQKFFLKVEKSYELEHIDDKQLQEPISNISNSTCQEKNSELSYYFERIMKQSQNNDNLDFWSTFIDIPNSGLPPKQTQIVNKRKNSFIAWENEEQQDEYLNSQPRKHVKLQ